VKVWLFYAGPENYLDQDGEREFAGVFQWSSAPGVSAGDLVLLYRRSLTKVPTSLLVEVTGMALEVAQHVRRSEIGSDIAAVWRVTSGISGLSTAGR
jgi:hypothetical protein